MKRLRSELFYKTIITCLFIFLLSSGVYSQSYAQPEFRGMWVTRYEWPSSNAAGCKKKIETIMKTLADANFNAVVFQVRSEAETLYPSDIEPWSGRMDYKDPGFDTMAFAIEEAHKNGLQFHAYINPMPLSGKNTAGIPHTTPEHLYYTHGPGTAEPWICMKKDGSPMDAQKAGYWYLSPGIPDVHVYLRKVVMDIVNRYDIDGIHYDRIRYPGPDVSYDEMSNSRFSGFGNPNNKVREDWQREQLDKLITDLYAEIKSAKPGVIVSAAVWGIYNRNNIPGYSGFSSGFHDYSQDSWAWVVQGGMDVIMPMIYWDIPAPKPNYNELLNDFIKGCGKDRVIGGQRAYGEKWDFNENIDEIKYSRQAGIPGTILFAYNAVKSKNGLELLPQTVFPTKVPVPEINADAKNKYGIILGTCTDAIGNPILDAHLKLVIDTEIATEEEIDMYGDEQVFKQAWTSSSDGRFAFLQVPPVPVKVVAEYKQKNAVFEEELKVSPGEVKKLTLKVYF